MNLLYAAYSRVSLDEQRNGISPDDQLRRIHAWAAHQSPSFILAQYMGEDGAYHPAEFIEDFSGFEYERPEMDQIRELARLGVINAVIVLRTDRFARDEAVYMLLERFFKKHNVRLFSVEEGEFTPGFVNRYVAAFQRARAEDDATTAKKRMHDARLGYLRSNVPQSQGYALYGYRKTGTRRETRYHIEEEEAKVVQLIYDWFTQDRLTYYAIATRLNEAGVPSPVAARRRTRDGYHGKWIDVTIRAMLKNPGYKGQLIGYKWKWQEGKEIATSKEEQVTIDIPAIVSEEQWNQANYLLEHKSGFKRSIRDYLLAGMTQCVCGHNMYGCSVSAVRKRKKERYYNYFYRCNSYDKLIGRPACENRYVSADALEYTVWDFIERLMRNPQVTIQLYRQEQETQDALLAETEARIAAIDELLEENKEELRRLQKMYQRGGCDDDYFDAEKLRLGSDREVLNRERDKAVRILDRRTTTARQLRELETIGEELNNGEVIDERKKRRTFERLCLTVTVEKEDSDGTRWLVVEVLGYSQRISLKTASAP